MSVRIAEFDAVIFDMDGVLIDSAVVCSSTRMRAYTGSKYLQVYICIYDERIYIYIR